jgi:hypothetical protein
MKSVFGRGFQGKVIGRDSQCVIIKCDYSMKGVRIGDPCRVDPYKFENGKERKNWMSERKEKT